MTGEQSLLKAFERIPIKTPQLIGIILGCLVFMITITVVIYLLFKSGTIAGALKELSGPDKRADTAHDNKAQTQSSEASQDNAATKSTRPSLYDSLLQTARALPLRPRVPAMLLKGVCVETSNAGSHFAELYAASNGSACYHESMYDAHARIWGLLDLSPPAVLMTCEETETETGESAEAGADRNRIVLKAEPGGKDAQPHGVPTSSPPQPQPPCPCPSLFWPATCPWPSHSEGAFRQWFAHAPLDGVHLSIVDKELGRAVGMLSLAHNRPWDLTVSICNIWLTPAYRKTSTCAGAPSRPPHAQLAVFLVLTWLFQLGYRRVTMEVDSANIAGRRLATRCGFQLEGELRKHRIANGTANQDTCLYAMLNCDWRSSEPDWRRRLGLGNMKTEEVRGRGKDQDKEA